MSQTFNLCIATETMANDAQQLDISIDTLLDIRVVVHVAIVQQPTLQLQLTYQITLPTQSLANQLHWPTWEETRVSFTDYLWEESCLECFIAGSTLNQDQDSADSADIINNNSTAAYIEINASPDGRYALYQFESYRNPVTLPPSPLLLANGRTRAKIDWIDHPDLQMPSISVNRAHKSSTAHTLYNYKRTFSVPIKELSSQNFAISIIIVEHIHPCAILWFGETALYFAPSHASPPDFHNRHYWSRFDAKAALVNQLASSTATER